MNHFSECVVNFYGEWMAAAFRFWFFPIAYALEQEGESLEGFDDFDQRRTEGEATEQESEEDGSREEG